MELESWENVLHRPSTDPEVSGELRYAFAAFRDVRDHAYRLYRVAVYRFEGVRPMAPTKPQARQEKIESFHLAFGVASLNANVTPARHAQREDDPERALCGRKLDPSTSTRLERGDDRPPPVYLIDCKRCQKKAAELVAAAAVVELEP